MATYTTNLNLKKPGTADAVNIADINGNMDTIDTAIQANTEAVASITKEDIGLGNVTNDAQIKKADSSTNGTIPTWSGTNGDQLANSSITLSNVLCYRGTLPSDANFNNYNTMSGIWTFLLQDDHTNGPDFGWGILVVFKANTYVKQIAYASTSATTKARSYNGTSWTAWA